MGQKDNSTFVEKVRLRRRVLDACSAPPMVLETHGGNGRIFERTWWKARGGIVIEKDAAKCEHLCSQRPTWAIYQGDSIKALEAGLAKAIAFDVIDLDPYGHPFNILAALALNNRSFPDRWHLVVNDGNRQNVKYGGSWHMAALTRAVRCHGTNLYPIYLEVARECVEEFADKIGFRISGWTGYYCGYQDTMTHYWAVLDRRL